MATGWGSTLSLVAAWLALVSGYSVVRYGVRDRMTQLGLGCGVLSAVAALFWWAPGVPMGMSLGFVALAAASLSARGTRSAFAALAVHTVLQPFLWFAGFTLLLCPLAMVWKHSHPEMAVVKVVLGMWLVGTYCVLTSLACATHTKIRQRLAV